MNKVLTKEELAIHIIENIEKNGEWVNDLGFKYEGNMRKSDNTLADMLLVLKGNSELDYMVVSSTEQEETYGVGGRFMYYGEEYILAQVGRQVCCLISLESGYRWADPISVSEVHRLTQEEFSEMCYYQSEKFIKI